MGKFMENFRAWNTLTPAQRGALREDAPYGRSLAKRDALRALQENRDQQRRRGSGPDGPWK